MNNVHNVNGFVGRVVTFQMLIYKRTIAEGEMKTLNVKVDRVLIFNLNATINHRVEKYVANDKYVRCAQNAK